MRQTTICEGARLSSEDESEVRCDDFMVSDLGEGWASPPALSLPATLTPLPV